MTAMKPSENAARQHVKFQLTEPSSGIRNMALWGRRKTLWTSKKSQQVSNEWHWGGKWVKIHSKLVHCLLLVSCLVSTWLPFILNQVICVPKPTLTIAKKIYFCKDNLQQFWRALRNCVASWNFSKSQKVQKWIAWGLPSGWFSLWLRFKIKELPVFRKSAFVLHFLN